MISFFDAAYNRTAWTLFLVSVETSSGNAASVYQADHWGLSYSVFHNGLLIFRRFSIGYCWQTDTVLTQYDLRLCFNAFEMNRVSIIFEERFVCMARYISQRRMVQMIESNDLEDMKESSNSQAKWKISYNVLSWQLGLYVMLTEFQPHFIIW